MFVKRRKSDGRTPEHGYTISFSAQADLKRLFNACLFFSSKMWFDAECIRYCLCAPISKPCHEILVFNQANNEAAVSHVITKTCPCNEDPLTPHLYIVKLGFTGIHIIVLYLL